MVTSARKAPSSAATNGNGSHAPDPVVDDAEVFDLDTLETDLDLTPLRFKVDGEQFELPHPNTLPWTAQNAMASEDGSQVLRAMFGDDDAYDRLCEHEFPGWKMEALMKRYAEHFGIDLGESQASPVSSVPTNRQSRRTSGRTTGSRSKTSRRGR